MLTEQKGVPLKRTTLHYGRGIALNRACLRNSLLRWKLGCKAKQEPEERIKQTTEANDDANLLKMVTLRKTAKNGAIILFINSRIGLPCAGLATRITGEPYSGNLYLRFDEDIGIKPPTVILLKKGN